MSALIVVLGLLLMAGGVWQFITSADELKLQLATIVQQQALESAVLYFILGIIVVALGLVLGSVRNTTRAIEHLTRVVQFSPQPGAEIQPWPRSARPSRYWAAIVVGSVVIAGGAVLLLIGSEGTDETAEAIRRAGYDCAHLTATSQIDDQRPNSTAIDAWCGDLHYRVTYAPGRTAEVVALP